MEIISDYSDWLDINSTFDIPPNGYDFAGLPQELKPPSLKYIGYDKDSFLKLMAYV